MKGLICSLLHLKPEEIKSITITNPIQLGEAMDDKEFILDIEVLLNNNTLTNPEMQVANELNWTDRSIAYLCRLFDQLYRGQKYKETLPVIHIEFLDFCLFADHPEFFGIYKLFKEKDHYLYSGKLALGVVDLTCIEKATERTINKLLSDAQEKLQEQEVALQEKDAALAELVAENACLKALLEDK